MSIKELVIPRSQWGKGRLRLTASDKMCCLGHLSVACGVPPEDLHGENFPLPSWTSVPEWARYPHRSAMPRAAPIMQRAAAINDSDRSTREAELIELFASQGIALSFVD